MKLFVAALAASLSLAGLRVVHAQSAPGSEAEPIRIGVLTDMSGPFADAVGPGSVAAARLAVADAGGTVLGRKIEVLSGDHQNKADVGAAIARDWFDTRHVDLVVDVAGSAVALAVQTIAREKHRVVAFTGAGATDLFGAQCSPTGFVWAFDTYALSHGTAVALMAEHLDTWFFLTPDFVFGKQLAQMAADVVQQGGGKVLGTATFPLTEHEFSSQLLAAQASGAKVIAITGGDLSTALKQAAEFGITARGQHFAAMLFWLNFVHAAGPRLAQGLYLTNSFYWDRTPESRAWSDRYFALTHAMPTMSQAGTYSAVLHFLKAVKQAGTTDGDAVAAAMRAMPVQDATASGAIRADGRLMRDYFLWQVKSPDESKGEWDLLKLVRTIPAQEAAVPLADSKCPLLRQ
jgi:branched-chain amino acid transport system substrate-binding protein